MARRSIRPASAIGHVEQLEGRSLMAADVTATLANGVLSIAGTDRGDDVTVGIDARGATFVATPGRGTVASFPSSSIRAIAASLGNGNDRMNIHLLSRSLDSVAVNMGDGVMEACRISVGSIGNLTVDATAAVGTSVLVANTVITNRAWLDFGNGAGNDAADIAGCRINSLWANLGADNDAFRIAAGSIASAAVSLGAGRDFCSIAPGTEIRSGTIDGGSNLPGLFSEDVLNRPRTMQGVRFINFERISG